jgi:hypothetical protein
MALHSHSTRLAKDTSKVAAYLAPLHLMLGDCACKRGRRWLLLGFLCFFVFTLLSFSHDRSPCGDYMLKYAATNVVRLKMYPCRSVNLRFGKTQRAKMIIRHEKM